MTTIIIIIAIVVFIFLAIFCPITMSGIISEEERREANHEALVKMIQELTD